MDEQPLTTIEVAKALGVHPDTVRDGFKAGQIPGWKTPGGHFRFHLAAVREALGDQAKAES